MYDILPCIVLVQGDRDFPLLSSGYVGICQFSGLEVQIAQKNPNRCSISCWELTRKGTKTNTLLALMHLEARATNDLVLTTLQDEPGPGGEFLAKHRLKIVNSQKSFICYAKDEAMKVFCGMRSPFSLFPSICFCWFAWIRWCPSPFLLWQNLKNDIKS